jgi:hypothetical protein
MGKEEVGKLAIIDNMPSVQLSSSWKTYVYVLLNINVLQQEVYSIWVKTDLYFPSKEYKVVVG